MLGPVRAAAVVLLAVPISAAEHRHVPAHQVRVRGWYSRWGPVTFTNHVLSPGSSQVSLFMMMSYIYEFELTFSIHVIPTYLIKNRS